MEKGLDLPDNSGKQILDSAGNENQNEVPIGIAIGDPIPSHGGQDSLQLQLGTVDRIMRYIMPRDAKVSKEAKEAMQECVTQFIQWVTFHANTRCQKQDRNILGAEDILFALKELGFDNYDKALRIFLNRYRYAQKKPKAVDLGFNMMTDDGIDHIAPRTIGPLPPVTLGFMPPMAALGSREAQPEGPNMNLGPHSSSSSNNWPQGPL